MAKHTAGHLFGIPVRVSKFVAPDKIVFIGAEKPTAQTVPSEVPRAHLPMTLREIQILDLKDGYVWGDEITYATEILVTKEGLKAITHYARPIGAKLKRKSHAPKE